jgi:hypothetical protein
MGYINNYTIQNRITFLLSYAFFVIMRSDIKMQDSKHFLIISIINNIYFTFNQHLNCHRLHFLRIASKQHVSHADDLKKLSFTDKI